MPARGRLLHRASGSSGSRSARHPRGGGGRTRWAARRALLVGAVRRAHVGHQAADGDGGHGEERRGGQPRDRVRPAWEEWAAHTRTMGKRGFSEAVTGGRKEARRGRARRAERGARPRSERAGGAWSAPGAWNPTESRPRNPMRMPRAGPSSCSRPTRRADHRPSTPRSVNLLSLRPDPWGCRIALPLAERGKLEGRGDELLFYGAEAAFEPARGDHSGLLPRRPRYEGDAGGS